jgi:hypothetical protein
MLELIVVPGQYEGYYYDDLVASLADKKERLRFEDWMWGQTCAIHNSKSLVYRWDWERYLAGLPVID